jgi:hypothetical protein
MVDRRFFVAAALASVGLAVGVATADFSVAGVRLLDDDNRIMRPATGGRDDLAVRLESARRTLEIQPEQEEAWTRYVDTALSLGRERVEFERRVTGGETHDDGSEYWRHQLVLAAAAGDLSSSLSPAQASRIGTLAGLADGFLCRGLSQNGRDNVR